MMATLCLLRSRPLLISNENLYKRQTLRAGWVTDFDGSVGGTYTAATGTLDTCYNMCSNGTWANCVGFSRVRAITDISVLLARYATPYLNGLVCKLP
jgi:hypothetical protein